MTMPIILSLAGYFVFSAAVGSMWPPTEQQKPRFYGWLYRTLQRLAANADRMAEAKFGALAGLPADPGGAATSTSSSTTSIVQQRVVDVAVSSTNK